MRATIIFVFTAVTAIVSPIAGLWNKRQDATQEADSESDYDYGDESSEEIPVTVSPVPKLKNIRIYREASFQGRTTNMILEQGKCRNVPPDFNNKISSIDAGGACIIVYQHTGCDGISAELRQENANMSKDLAQVEMDHITSSVKLCE